MSKLHLTIGSCAGIFFLAIFGLSHIQQQSSVRDHHRRVSNTEQQNHVQQEIHRESRTEKQTFVSPFSRDVVQHYPQIADQRAILEQYKKERKQAQN